MLKARYFNSLQLDNLSKIVTKTSENTEKLINEIHWYKSIPDEISELTPKLMDSETSDNPFLKLEYVGLPTLAEIWLYTEFSNDFWFTNARICAKWRNTSRWIYGREVLAGGC